MANQKISALTALTGANVEQTADVLPIVDNSAGATKKILVSELSQALLVLGTAQATTAGTSIDFTSIPAWVKQITMTFVGVSTNGTSNLQIQIGDSGGVETSGYLSNAAGATNAVVVGTQASPITTGFLLTGSNGASDAWHGQIIINLHEASSFTWTASGILISSGSSLGYWFAGSKATSAALDRVRLTTVNGSDTFDAGKVNILSE